MKKILLSSFFMLTFLALVVPAFGQEKPKRFNIKNTPLFNPESDSFHVTAPRKQMSYYKSANSCNEKECVHNNDEEIKRLSLEEQCRIGYIFCESSQRPTRKGVAK